jgi:hypothetical protein
VISGAVVRVSSAALIGGEIRTTTNEKGQLRFPALPPGSYTLEVEMSGFTRYRDASIRVGAGSTIERTAVLSLAGIAESLTVEGLASRIEARGSGLETRFVRDDIRSIPTGRFSMFDFIRPLPVCHRRLRRAVPPAACPRRASPRSVQVSTKTSS